MMLRMDKKSFLYSYPFVALLAAGMALLVMLPAILRFDGVFLIRGDYLEQYLTRLMTARRMLTGDGFPMWDWTAFLGEPYNNTMAFFSLDTLCLLVPERWLLPVSCLGNVFRFALGAASACAYLRCFVRKENACLGGLLYAFSSYCLVALEFAQFNNAAAVFPLLLLGIERLFAQERYCHFLILAAFVNAHLNPYLFIQSSIFLLVYALVRFFCAETWRNRRAACYIAQAIFEYLIGALLAGVTLVQFAAVTLSSAKISGRMDGVSLIGLLKLLVPTDLLDVLAGLTSAGASNRFDTFGRDTRWLSFAAYTPLFGCSLWGLYLYRHRRKSSVGLCVGISLLMACLPLCNNLFNLYTAHYSRWWYCLMLMLVLASMLAWQELDTYEPKLLRRSLWIPLLVLTGVMILSEALIPLAVSLADGFLGAVFAKLARSTGELATERRFQLFSLAVTLLGTGLTAVMYRSQRLRKRVLALMSAFLVLYGGCYVMINNTDDFLLDHAPESAMTLDEMVQRYLDSAEMDNSEDGYSYRVDYPPQLGNYGTAHNYPAISAFSSEVNRTSAQVGRLLEYENGGEDVRWWPGSSSNAIRTLLSVKYYFDYYPDDDGLYPVPDGFVYAGNRGDVSVYENENFLPIGFAYDSYVSFSRAEEQQDTALLMLNTLVVDDEDTLFAQQVLKPWNGELLNAADAAEERRTTVCTEFVGTTSGFSTTVEAEEDCVVFFSVPHTAGWKARVDGKEAEIHTVNGGFMALAVEEGHHEIVFSYMNPSLKYGCAVTALGLLLLGGYLLLRRKDSGHEKQTAESGPTE